MDSNNLILFFVLISFGIFFYKYFVFILSKYYPKLLIDNQLSKPQAFHQFPISTAGGAVLFFSFLVVYFDFFILKNISFFAYLSFWVLVFLSSVGYSNFLGHPPGLSS